MSAVYVDPVIFGHYMMGIIAGILAIEIGGPLINKIRGEKSIKQLFESYSWFFITSLAFFIYSAVALDLEQIPERERWGRVAMAVVAADVWVKAAKGALFRLWRTMNDTLRF